MAGGSLWQKRMSYRTALRKRRPYQEELRFADAVRFEADLAKFGKREDVATVE